MFYINGYIGLVLVIVFVLVGGWLVWVGVIGDYFVSIFLGVLLIIIVVFGVSLLIIVGFNEVCVLIFFGKYIGIICDLGLFMIVLLISKFFILLWVCNFNSVILKVNDFWGNFVEIVVVIVFKVVDISMVFFVVDDYE